MAEEKSALVYTKSAESQDKFDYFIAAVTGAISTYTLQSYKPAILDLNSSTLEALGLLILFASFFIGLLRIQSTVLVYRHNCDCLRFGELASQLIQKMEQPGHFVGIEPGTGMEFTKEQIPLVIEKYKTMETCSNQAAEAEGRKASRYYLWRNRSLVIGFLFLLAAKLLQPYLSEVASEVGFRLGTRILATSIGSDF